MPPRPDITQLVAFRQQPQSSNSGAPPPPTSLVHGSSAGDSRLFDFNVAQQQLRPYIKNALQDRVLRLPGRVVAFIRGRVRPEQIMSMRDSYINAFLIQSRGTRAPTPCTGCQARMEKDPQGYASPFPTCVRLPGHFGGSCGNCKWRDHAARCSVRDPHAGVHMPRTRSQSTSPPQNQRQGRTRGLLTEGSASNPIALDDSDEDDDNNEAEYDDEFELDGSSGFHYNATVESEPEEDEGDDEDDDEEGDGSSSRPVRLLGN